MGNFNQRDMKTVERDIRQFLKDRGWDCNHAYIKLDTIIKLIGDYHAQFEQEKRKETLKNPLKVWIKEDSQPKKPESDFKTQMDEALAYLNDSETCKTYEIDFDGNVKAKLTINGDGIEIDAAMNGWGNPIVPSKCKIERI